AQVDHHDEDQDPAGVPAKYDPVPLNRGFLNFCDNMAYTEPCQRKRKIDLEQDHPPLIDPLNVCLHI
ncbi:hypothetical protein HN709_03135, partial [Candidatus Peregrinibacteria bacterium]|nr:hypothetical protein [Candidatus Peregrinibacteria bacterium]